MYALHEAFNFMKPQDRCVGKLLPGLHRATMLQQYAKKYDVTTHFIQTRKCEVDRSWMEGAEYDNGRVHRLPAELIFTIRLVWKKKNTNTATPVHQECCAHRSTGMHPHSTCWQRCTKLPEASFLGLSVKPYIHTADGEKEEEKQRWII